MNSPIKIIKRNLGTSYRLIFEISAIALASSQEYRTELYNSLFDFINDLKNAHTPDSLELVEVPEEKLHKD